jgi:chemotaxis protein MotB
MVGADEAEQAKRRSAELERQLADLQKQLTDRDRELAALRGDLSVQMARLQEAQRGIGKALRKEVEKGTILVDLRQDHLLVIWPPVSCSDQGRINSNRLESMRSRRSAPF